MADRMAAQIWIGGGLSAKQAEELCGAIADERASLDWGDRAFRPSMPQDLIQACDEDDDSQVLRLCDDQASWGEFADLESFLQEHAIPYTRHGEGGGSYNGEIVEYRPGNDPVCTSVDANGNPNGRCRCDASCGQRFGRCIAAIGRGRRMQSDTAAEEGSASAAQTTATGHPTAAEFRDRRIPNTRGKPWPIITKSFRK